MEPFFFYSLKCQNSPFVMLAHIYNTPSSPLVVPSYSSSVTSTPKVPKAGTSQWSCWICECPAPWRWLMAVSCLASGTAVPVITPTSSMRKVVSTVSIWFFLFLPKSDPFIRLNFEAIPSTWPPPRATPCLVLEGTLHSRLQQVPVAYCSFLAQLLLPFPRQKQLLPAFHTALSKQ